MGKEKGGEKAFAEDGLLDDKCAACSRRCCCAPPPFRVALVPVIFLLACFIVLYVILTLDLTGLCKTSPDRNNVLPCVPPTNQTTVSNAGLVTARIPTCPSSYKACDFVHFADVTVENWSMFFIIVIAGYAILRAIVSIVWWIIRALSGKHGLVWAYAKPNDTPVAVLIWNFLFFLTYNSYLFYATPIVYTMCTYISAVTTIACIIAIIVNVISTAAARYLTKSARKRLDKARNKAKLIDKILKLQKKTFTSSLTFGLSDIAVRSAKNAKAVAAAAKDGDDVVIELKDSTPEVTDELIAETFAKVAGSKGHTNKDELAKYADVSGPFAKDLWAIFSSEPKGTIYKSEFEFGIRNVERAMRDVQSELKNREFIGDIVHTVILIIGILVGVVICADAIGLDLTAILSFLAIFGLGVGMVISGAFGQIFTAFLFLLTTKAYYVGDIITIGGDTMIVKKITLLNTFGVQFDGQYAIINNAAIAQARIINRTRSDDCNFIFDAAISPATTQAQLDQWRAAIQGYIDSNPETWKSLGFNITAVDSIDNKMVVTMAATVRGANWSRGDLFLPRRSELFNFIRKAAGQIGISYHRAIQPTTAVTLPAPQPETAPADLNLGVKKTAAGKTKSDAKLEVESDSDSESSDKEKKKKSKKKDKESKKSL